MAKKKSLWKALVDAGSETLKHAVEGSSRSAERSSNKNKTQGSKQKREKCGEC